jgi:hypothetical protein
VATAQAKRKKEAEHAQATLSRYDSEENFRLLHDRVAELLKFNLEHLCMGDIAKIGLAAMWCPSLRSSYDRSTLMCARPSRAACSRVTRARSTSA